MQEVIRVERLTKSYGRLLAANNISFSVMPGMVFGLLGANGAGKSTVIECVLGTKRMDGGQVSILGMNPLAHRKNYSKKWASSFRNQITRTRSPWPSFAKSPRRSISARPIPTSC